MAGTKRHNRIRKFMTELSRALELENAGTHGAVFNDESYIHQNHSRPTSWVGENRGAGNATSKGKRLALAPITRSIRIKR